MPPAAAIAEPSAKVKEMMKSMLMPTSEAALGLSETARIAVPIFVFMTMNRSAKRSTSVTMITTTWLLEM